jgi:hypothetical protein
MSGDLYFRYPVLDLTFWQRFLGRIGGAIINIVLLVLAAVALLSNIPGLMVLGVPAAVYLVLRFGGRWVGGWRSRSRFKGGNLVEFVTPRAKKMILSAYDRSAFLGGSFALHLTRELVEEPIVVRVLRGLGINRDELVSKLEGYLLEERGVRETNIWRQARVEEIVVRAFILQDEKKDPITPFHLFMALPYADNERVRRLFVLFGLGADSLERAARYHALISA